MRSFTDEQLKAVNWFEGPAMVIGTPGSGKTTVIINRIRELIVTYKVQPSQILVITFTRAAARSMEERFLELIGEPRSGVRFGTFHSFFYWIIRTAYGNQISVLEENEKRNILRRILFKLDKENYSSEELLTSVINQFGTISCGMIDIEDYYSKDMPEYDFRAVYRSYQDEKRRQGFIDFDDMLSMTYRLLSERKDIRERLQAMYPYIMVDEYQDTNLLQYEILKLLTHPRDNLYVVGDDDQSIYGFRGARPDIMLSFKKEYPSAEIMSLSTNFRCPREIVDISSKLISGNKSRYNKSLVSGVTLPGEVKLIRPQDVSDENKRICIDIDSYLKAGVKADDIAVLFRTNLGPRRLIMAMQQRNIPFYIKDALPDIYSSPYIVPIIDYMAFAAGDTRRSTFLRFMNKPVRYISRDMLREEIDISDLLKAARGKDYLVKNIRRLSSELRTIGALSPYSAINYIRKAVGYESYILDEAERKHTDKDEIVELLDEFQESVRDCKNYSEMQAMIENVRSLLNENKSDVDRSGKVQLMTLHSAKGLEFEFVHIMDCVDDVIPHKKSKSKRDIEEERRLLYVGMTRSSKILNIYAPREMGEKETKISPFISGLDGGL